MQPVERVPNQVGFECPTARAKIDVHMRAGDFPRAGTPKNQPFTVQQIPKGGQQILPTYSGWNLLFSHVVDVENNRAESRKSLRRLIPARENDVGGR